MKGILFTGFSVWGQERYNSSWEILKDANLTLPGGWNCQVHQLPVSWVQAPKILESLITPDVKVVVCMGMTGGDEVVVDRIATNLINPSWPVVDNTPPPSEFVCADGPPAYYTTLPVYEILTALREQNVPCDFGLWSGPHTCSLIFYWLMHFIAQRRPDMSGGFIHVPPLEEHGGLSREVLGKAVEVIAQIVTSHADQLLRFRRDID